MLANTLLLTAAVVYLLGCVPAIGLLSCRGISTCPASSYGACMKQGLKIHLSAFVVFSMYLIGIAMFKVALEAVV